MFDMEIPDFGDILDDPDQRIIRYLDMLEKKHKRRDNITLCISIVSAIAGVIASIASVAALLQH